MNEPDHATMPYCDLLDRIKELEDCLKAVVYEHGYVTNGELHGLGAIAEAMAVIDLPNPCRMPEGILCDEPGCMKRRTCGWPSETGYRHTCGEHMRDD